MNKTLGNRGLSALYAITQLAVCLACPFFYSTLPRSLTVVRFLCAVALFSSASILFCALVYAFMSRARELRLFQSLGSVLLAAAYLALVLVHIASDTAAVGLLLLLAALLAAELLWLIYICRLRSPF